MTSTSDAEIQARTKTAFWSQEVVRLRSQLNEAEEQLRQAWKQVPYDPEILKKPYESDIAVSCYECGRLTKWRTGKGGAHCQPLCPTARGPARPRIAQEIWDFITATTTESLDDD